MSMDKEVLDELARQSENWNQIHIAKKAPKYGEPAKANTGNATMDALAPLIASIAGDVAALKRKVAALEARPAIKYLGVHKPGATYSEGSMVTRDGSIFYCHKTTTAAPGDGSQDWQLAVKRGKDAR